MDYDKLVQGRRRNWDALKPEEVRKREREAARAQRIAEREAKEEAGEKPTTYERLRQRIKDHAEEADVAQYRTAVRKAWIILAILVLVGVAAFVVDIIVDRMRRQSYQEDMQSFEYVLVQGQEVDSPATPVGALATWRSAWQDGDMNKVVDLLSERYIRNVSKNRNRDRLRPEYERLYKAGSLQNLSDIATNFAGAEILRIPRKPWTEGVLCLFRSDYLPVVGLDGPGVRYIATFSYDAKAAEWRFADVREAEFFNIQWEYESSILPKRAGTQAIRYDEQGKLIRGDGEL